MLAFRGGEDGPIGCSRRVFHFTEKLPAGTVQHGRRVATFQPENVQRVVRLASVQPQPIFAAARERQMKAVHELLEKLFRLLKKALRERHLLAVAERGEFLKLVLLVGVKMRRHLDLDADVQITWP